MLTHYFSDPRDRPTASRLLGHPFCFIDPHYNFFDTELWDKIKGKIIKGHSSNTQPGATQQSGSQSQTPRAGDRQIQQPLPPTPGPLPPQ
jgi:hypothetical protein